MEALIKVVGEISPEEASLMDVISQFKSYDNPTSIKVEIDSVGGYVSEGDAIHDYLKALNLPITTIATEKCMSIATKIHLCGDVRKAYKNCQYMIHNPFLDEFTGDADMLMEASKAIRKTEDAFMNFYAETLNLPVEAIKPLAKRTTFLNSDQLLNLGFVNEIIDNDYNQTAKKYKAVAKLDVQMNDSKETLSLLQRIELGIKNLGKKLEPKAELVLQDEVSGVELIFSGLEPDQMPTVGDSVTAENGTYTVSGMILEVENGVVTEMEQAEAKEDMNEMEQMKKDMEEITAMFDGLKKESEEQAKELAKYKEIAETKADLEKQLKEVKAMVSVHDLESDKRDHKAPEAKAKGSSFKDVLTQLKNKR